MGSQYNLEMKLDMGFKKENREYYRKESPKQLNYTIANNSKMYQKYIKYFYRK